MNVNAAKAVPILVTITAISMVIGGAVFEVDEARASALATELLLSPALQTSPFTEDECIVIAEYAMRLSNTKQA